MANLPPKKPRQARFSNGQGNRDYGSVHNPKGMEVDRDALDRVHKKQRTAKARRARHQWQRDTQHAPPVTLPTPPWETDDELS